MSIIDTPRPSPTDDPGPRRHRPRPRALRLLALLGLTLALAGALTYRFLPQPRAAASVVMPQSPAMEDRLGLRFTHAALVADGGLIELRYLVLDEEKASNFQSDITHPPLLISEAHGGDPLDRTALMKQGHTLRAGQDYFVIYQNAHNTMRRGELMTIKAAGVELTHVPVE